MIDCRAVTFSIHVSTARDNKSREVALLTQRKHESAVFLFLPSPVFGSLEKTESPTWKFYSIDNANMTSCHFAVYSKI